MKWSTALFGHEKPRYYVQNENTGFNIHQFVEHPGDMPFGMKLHVCTGVEKRAEPGDVIAFKPDRCWHCDEKQHADIVSMIRNPKYLMSNKAEIKAAYLAGSDPNNWRPAARFERIWAERHLKIGLDNPALLPEEIREYFSFLPGASMWHLRGADTWGEHERRLFLLVDLDDLETDQLVGATEPQFDVEKHPEYIKKRRFKIQLDDLETVGVDIDRMLDPNIKYVPGVGLSRLHCFDKLHSRKINKSDKLRPIQAEKAGA
jgi:hypothetical protein